ncbi:MAG: Fe-S-containing hydro-lyase [Bacillota bacterium]|nr:Fe-S-containing hydro-lyase [Bacillota bacterium]
MAVKINTPITREQTRELKCGDSCLISGVIYTARDAAHKRIYELIEKGEKLPLEIRDAVIYYVGPTPAKEGWPIGSAGPTSSYRMDAYTPLLIEKGLTGMIGKGRRGPEVVAAMKKYGAVYFGAIGGAGALLSKCIVKAKVVAYDDLGAEAVRRLEVKNFPAVLAIDASGRSLYEAGRKAYLDSFNL